MAKEDKWPLYGVAVAPRRFDADLTANGYSEAIALANKLALKSDVAIYKRLVVKERRKSIEEIAEELANQLGDFVDASGINTEEEEINVSKLMKCAEQAKPLLAAYMLARSKTLRNDIS